MWKQLFGSIILMLTSSGYAATHGADDGPESTAPQVKIITTEEGTHEYFPISSVSTGPVAPRLAVAKGLEAPRSDLPAGTTDRMLSNPMASRPNLPRLMDRTLTDPVVSPVRSIDRILTIPAVASRGTVDGMLMNSVPSRPISSIGLVDVRPLSINAETPRFYPGDSSIAQRYDALSETSQLEDNRLLNFLPMKPPNPVGQIVRIEVQCYRQYMNVRIEFDLNFNGIIYSESYFNDPDCRYVEPNSQQRVYEFRIHADRCGSTLIEKDPQSLEAVLQNTIVIQNHGNYQEVWDTARTIRCTWNAQYDHTVSSGVNLGILDIETISYSGDAVGSYMDIQVGQGPFSTPVAGLVKIGELLSMVIYVYGNAQYDVQVKDCIAHDGDTRNAIQLTDTRGCVLEKKLLGPWQKTRQTGNTNASTIAFSFFHAFKFPEKMEVFLECNIEICKIKCLETCPENAGITQNVYGREKNEEVIHSQYKKQKVRSADTIKPMRILRGISVIFPPNNTNRTNSPLPNPEKITETLMKM